MSPIEFQYFISEKNGFIVASLVGLLESAGLGKLEELSAEILKSDFKRLIINFRDVSGISVETIPHIAKLQKIAREKEADLRLCGLRPEIKERLHRAGILCPMEVQDNLQTALQSLVPYVRKVS